MPGTIRPSSQGQAGPRAVGLQHLAQQLGQAQHAQPNPDGKGKRGPREGVVPFARLKRRLVEVHHNGHARKQEQQAGHPASLPVAAALKPQANQAQNERNGQEVVVRRALANARRQAVGAGAEGRHHARLLNVGLAAHVVPHEVAPEHVAHLVAEQEAQVLAHGGLHAVLNIHPLLVVGNLVGLVAVEAGSSILSSSA